jgi:steroid 5-alpha reductase family enzyme
MKKAIDSLIVLGSAGLAGGVGWAAGVDSYPLLGVSSLLVFALLAVAIQWVAFIPAYWAHSERYYDLIGALTYIGITAAALGFAQSSDLLDPFRLTVGLLVMVWALRLGSYLFSRVKKDGKDGRFDAIKSSFLAFLIAWTVQGLWVVLTALGALVIITDQTPRGDLSLLSLAGLCIWGLGFGIEVIADRQKAAFRADPINSGKWINQGLWRLAQHPNYCGEILLWTGIFLAGMDTFEGAQWLAILSPIFTGTLLVFVSGVRMVRARNIEKWGDDEGYLLYLKEVPMLIPIPRKRKGSVD